MKTISLKWLLLLALSLSACGGGSGGDNQGTSEGSIPVIGGLTLEVQSGQTAQVEIEPSTTKFVVTAERAGTGVSINRIIGPNGVDYLAPNGTAISLASSVQDSLATASVPSRASDPAISGGIFQIQSQASDGGPITLTIQTSADPNFSGGSVQINIILVGSIAQGAAPRASVEAAIPISTRILRNAGINAQFSLLTLDGPNVIPLPTSANALYAQGSSLGQSPAINVFVAADISTEEIPIENAVVLGIASSIPGPPFPSPRSGVAISLITSAGVDGVFSPGELELLGQTIAHESSHFMGLFHVVEIDIESQAVVGNDPLGDTETCSSFEDCASQAQTVQNVMFPFPVPLGPGRQFVPQENYTGEQSGVLERYFAVN